MKLGRRSVLKALLAVVSGSLLPFRALSADRKIRHILSACSDTKIAVCLSTHRPARNLMLSAGERSVVGRQTDSQGRHWQFMLDGLSPDTRHRLSVWEEGVQWGQALPRVGQ